MHPLDYIEDSEPIMKKSLKDIPIKEVLEQQQKWCENNHRNFKSIEDLRDMFTAEREPNPFTYEVLGPKYGSEKLVFKKMEQLCRDGYLEYGTSIRTAWLTDKGKETISNL